MLRHYVKYLVFFVDGITMVGILFLRSYTHRAEFRVTIYIYIYILNTYYVHSVPCGNMACLPESQEGSRGQVS